MFKFSGVLDFHFISEIRKGSTFAQLFPFRINVFDFQANKRNEGYHLQWFYKKDHR